MASGEATLTLKIKEIGSEILDRVVVTLGDIGNVAKFMADKVMEAGKALVDLVFEGSKIAQINSQFEFLAKNAGVSADILRSQLVGAVDGLVDDTDVIKAASGALLILGKNAADLPKLMELATASSKVMGGTVIDAFERITNAIASGRVMALSHLGITIDQNKAFKDMADKVGIAADKLNKAQEQQAILNAVLATGSTALIDAGKNSDTVGEAFTRLKVGLAQLHESMAKVANKQFGGIFTKIMDQIGGGLSWVANKSMMIFGDESEKAEAKLASLGNELKNWTAVQERLASKPGYAESVAKAGKEIERVQAEIAALEQTAAAKHGETGDKQSAADKDRYAKDEAQLRESLMKKTELQMGSDILATQNAIDHNKAMSDMSMAQEEEKATLVAQINLKDAESQLAQNNILLGQATDQTIKLALLKEKARLQENVNQAKFNLGEATIAKAENDKILAHRSAFLGELSSLQSLKNQQMLGIAKTAAVAQVTIATTEAAASGFKWGMAMGGIAGPALGTALAALAYASGAMKIAEIGGIHLAEGGIVMPRPGGTQATIGEAGQAEAVIPLDKMGGMGGGVTIVVNGGLLGDAASAREFAIAVDRQLLELRRNNESVSFDGRVV